MESFVSLYDVLQVSTDSTLDEIKTAFRKFAKLYHPDVNNSNESEAKFIIINNAYQILSDVIKREEYDKYLKSIKAFKRNTNIESAGNAQGKYILFVFSCEKLFSHINYILWDIEIFLNDKYKNCFNVRYNGLTVKEYILKILIFIDKWVLYPSGYYDYFMKSRKMKDINISDYMNLIDSNSSHFHRPFYSISDYFYDVRKRIDKFMNKVTVKDLFSQIPECDIRLIDGIIETQNYIIHYMGSIKRALSDGETEIAQFKFSNSCYEK
jgi:hypothetical protein